MQPPYLSRLLVSRLPVFYGWIVLGCVCLAGVLLSVGTFALIGVGSASIAYLAAGVFGLGIGGMTTLIPVAWADYFGRESLGAIRSVALSLQVVAQATGPLLSGALRDWSGNYTTSLATFGVLAALAAVVALVAQRPNAAASRLAS